MFYNLIKLPDRGFNMGEIPYFDSHNEELVLINKKQPVWVPNDVYLEIKNVRIVMLLAESEIADVAPYEDVVFEKIEEPVKEDIAESFDELVIEKVEEEPLIKRGRKKSIKEE